GRKPGQGHYGGEPYWADRRRKDFCPAPRWNHADPDRRVRRRDAAYSRECVRECLKIFLMIRGSMRQGSNPIEEYKQSKEGNPLRITEDLPRLITRGWEALSPSDKELLKWVGIFFRKPTPGKFMMRLRMPNGFATSAQLAAIADVSKRLGNGTVDITTRQQIELRGYTIESIPEIWQRLRGVDL